MSIYALYDKLLLFDNLFLIYYSYYMHAWFVIVSIVYTCIGVHITNIKSSLFNAIIKHVLCMTLINKSSRLPDNLKICQCKKYYLSTVVKTRTQND